MFFTIVKLCLFLGITSCISQPNSPSSHTLKVNMDHINNAPNLISLIDSMGQTVSTRFIPPKGYKRINGKENSFENYLQNLPLKPLGAKVMYFNGETKNSTSVYDAVVALPIGKKDLHQCADAIIRLRGEWLFKTEQFNKIHFNFTNGFRADYSEWIQGKRIKVTGNHAGWTSGGKVGNSYQSFWSYLETVFTYAGTLSLSNETETVALSNMAIGDIFIQGGSPGHAVIVVDMALNCETGEKIFLLAQSYMPAQEIQILTNPNSNNLSPWYNHNINNHLITPEWIFNSTDLKRFKGLYTPN